MQSFLNTVLADPAQIVVASFIVAVLSLAAVVAVLFRMMKMTRQMDDFRQQAEVSDKKDAELFAARLDDLKSELRSQNTDLKTTQSNHFVNFLGLVNAGAETQQQAAARLQSLVMEQLKHQSDSQEKRLEAVTAGVSESMTALKNTLASELEAIRNANDRALAGMRETVDEKLQTTLNTRLTESFRIVEDQLLAVHKGLGEMREMAGNVDALRRVLTNVKTRGTFGEVQLSMILADILTPEQYLTNVATRPGSSERVEFAVRLPGPEEGSEVLLPIDAKFPLDDYERLLAASAQCDAAGQAVSIKALQTRILLEAAKIREKYVEVPYTTEFAVLYLPAESLWSEVLKIPGLIERVRRDSHVTITGPTVLAAFLNSLQMGFKTVAIQKKSAEVWRLLGEVKAEFIRFNEAVGGMEKRIDSVKSAIGAVRTRTNVMAKKLRGIESAVDAPVIDINESDRVIAAEQTEQTR